MYLLDYILPQVAKLSCAIETKHLDLSLISSLVDATLDSLDDAILPSENWVLQLQDAREELKAETGIEVTHFICSFQERVGRPFIRHIKVTHPVGSDPTQKMCYQPSVFLIQRSYLYMETVQFKLALDSLGEIYQLNHWKEMNLRRQPLSLQTTTQKGKRIVSSLAAKR